MKKAVNTVVDIALLLHLIIWVMFLTVAVANYLTYEDVPNMEPYFNFLSKAENAFHVFVAAIGIITSAVLFFSVRAFLKRSSAEIRENKIIALCLSAAGTLFFYLSIISIIYDCFSFIFFIAWLFCELFGCTSLFHSKERKKPSPRLDGTSAG